MNQTGKRSAKTVGMVLCRNEGFARAIHDIAMLPLLCGLLAAIAAAAPAAAEVPGSLSMNDMVLSWMRGNYASPIVCKMAGGVHRGLRRILIDAGPKSTRPAVDLVRFVDLEAEAAERCFTEIGGSTPNIIGELQVRHPTHRPRDTAVRDFKVALKREHGFDVDIVSGRLTIRAVGPSAAAAEVIDFRAGSLRLHLLREGSDGLRLLKDLPSPRQALLEIETRKGRKFSFPVSLSKPSAAGKGARNAPIR